MKIALDWTPNVMHTGLYVAKAKGWLDIEFISPEQDDYTILPSDKVLSGLVDFSIGPPEILIDHHLTNSHPQLLAVAPILHTNTSAFVSLKENNIRTLSDWQGKSYAALDIPFEIQLLEKMLQPTAGTAALQIFTPLKLDTWKMLLAGETDLVWAFLPVEGAEAAYRGIELNVFKLADAGIPYPACPLIQTTRNLAEAAPDAIDHFLKAVQQGYQYAIDYPEEAVQLLRKGSHINWIEDMRLLLHCQKEINRFYLNSASEWGRINAEALITYTDWLFNVQIIRRKPDVNQLFWKALATRSH